MTQAATLTKGSISVEIGSAKIEHDIQNTLIKFAIPVIDDQDTTVPTVFVEDIKRFIQLITITGYLLSDSASSALAKKQALISPSTLGATHPLAASSIGAVWKSGSFTLTWRSETYTVYVDKIKITDDSGRKDKTAYCTDSQYTTQGTCEGAGEVWFPLGVDKYQIIITLTVQPS